MTTSEVSSGLVLPFSALTIAGSGGAAAVILITFMAVTSTLSAQVIAVSSIISFDIYREYFNKSASDRQIIRWSHFGVVFFAFFSAAFSTMLYYVGADLQWTLYMLGEFVYSSIKNTSYNKCRSRYMPWYLPHGLHRPLAWPKHTSGYSRSYIGSCNRIGSLDYHSPLLLWGSHSLLNRPSYSLCVRYRRFSILATPIFCHHNISYWTTEL